jgi:NAD(P)-dependent dehydrogenase (short-subunit alcohol dehydrogenase family)
MSADIATQIRDLPLLATVENSARRVFIVTGANTGLGFEAAKHLVSLGAAKVIIAVRNISSGQEAKAKIEADTGKANVADVWQLDLASYDSVKAFAKRAVTELDRIDVLIENAAVAPGQRILAEGHNSAVTVNVLSTFLLAMLLLPKLSETASKYDTVPHITFVSSGVGFDVKQEWEKVQDDPIVKMDDESMIPLVTYVPRRYSLHSQKYL